jgi:hypothetical protein
MVAAVKVNVGSQIIQQEMPQLQVQLIQAAVEVESVDTIPQSARQRLACKQVPVVVEL